MSRAVRPGADEGSWDDAGPDGGRGLRAALRGVVPGVRARLVGRDLALIAAGLTFYAGIAVVPLLVLAFGLTAWLTSAERVQQLGTRLAELLPDELGAPDAVARLVDAGAELDLVGALLALLPMSLYGEGLRRALLRFSSRHEGMTGWRGRLAAVPLLLLTPVLLYPLLLAASLMADLAARGGFAATTGQVALGYYAVLAALTVPLAWGFRVVGGSRVRWPALTAGALFTAACLSGFLQGFVLFLALPLDLGAPFGGLDVVGGVVALGLWLFALHLVVLCGWLATQSLDQELARGSARGQAVGQPPVDPGLDLG
ncbi:YhjD/YihY/BrkB family envelope integrity protein [Blastococcus saxobsidens]|uniref:Ribonuclease BN (Modular protein) n=1 Tax=Blastococcus saxobsidens (strain DD2) TaxID=1146883 RepID=H6RSD3_BLASD|nr:YhjD/YihY/BrkB family envelope integrity protein [Blastococcus saxobsidens]CCG05525.1 Ribonuclease BN (modular protein) [Blastococcus saxobsidens DD2]